MVRSSFSPVHGVLVVDKPRGPTSHDVVLWARQAFKTRAIGHAGTLDPLATGVLLLLVGEARKLTPYLSRQPKEYEATILLGKETDTLDGEGEVVTEATVPAGLTLQAVADAAAGFLGATRQTPPASSAVKLRGQPLYARLRRGESVEPSERDVFVHTIDVMGLEDDRVSVRLCCDGGFYVRSFARDLSLALGTRGYLGELRRTRSGGFSVEDGVGAEMLQERADGSPVALQRKLVSLLQACSLPAVQLSEEGEIRARHGRPVPRCMAEPRESSPAASPVALVSPGGELVAIARQAGEAFEVVRGFNSQSS